MALYWRRSICLLTLNIHILHFLDLRSINGSTLPHIEVPDGTKLCPINVRQNNHEFYILPFPKGREQHKGREDSEELEDAVGPNSVLKFNNLIVKKPKKDAERKLNYYDKLFGSFHQKNDQSGVETLEEGVERMSLEAVDRRAMQVFRDGMDHNLLLPLGILKVSGRKGKKQVVVGREAEDGAYSLVMPYMERLRPLYPVKKQDVWNADKVMALAKRMCKAIGALVEHGICHMDIKPANVLGCFEHNVYLLFDYDISRVQGDSAKGLTAPFAPPEYNTSGVCEKDGRYDLYSTGMMLSDLARMSETTRPVAPHPFFHLQDLLLGVSYVDRKECKRMMEDLNIARLLPPVNDRPSRGVFTHNLFRLGGRPWGVRAGIVFRRMAARLNIGWNGSSSPGVFTHDHLRFGRKPGEVRAAIADALF